MSLQIIGPDVRIKVRNKLNKDGILYDLLKNKLLYLMVLPTVIYFILFSYLPLYGLTLAFKHYSPGKGIFNCPWAGLDNYKFLFNSVQSMFFIRAFKNSLIISSLKLVVGFPVPIIIALLLNEIKAVRYKKLVQTTTFLPYFMSWVVVGSLVAAILSPSGGIVNGIISVLGYDPINFFADNTFFRWVLVFSDIWKGAGYNVIIYLAAISAIDPQIYTAAMVDGANRWHQIVYITLPGIARTIAILLIISAGYIMYAGFEQVFVMYSPAVYDSADIIDTYIYRIGVSQGKFDIATSAALLQAGIGFILLMIFNKVAKKIGQGETGLF